jgi:hypothetical protein
MVAKNTRTDRDETLSSLYRHPGGRALEPGRLARLLARARAGSLDRALIAGADPAGSRQLAARAAALTSPRVRALTADGLERLLQAAQGPPSRRRVLPRRDPVLASASELRELATRLREPAPLYARGVAIAGELLTDGSGPVYLGDRQSLALKLHEARAALAGQDMAVPA